MSTLTLVLLVYGRYMSWNSFHASSGILDRADDVVGSPTLVQAIPRQTNWTCRGLCREASTLAQTNSETYCGLIVVGSRAFTLPVQA
jgi:hypothetical protein